MSSKYSTSSRDERLDAEILELEARLATPGSGETIPVIEQVKEIVSPETPIDWEKRYGDLRRFSQKQVDDKEKLLQEQTNREQTLAQRVKELEAARNETEFPRIRDKEELMAWMKEVPDAAGMIRTLIKEETSGSVEDLANKNKKLQDDIEVFKREKEMNHLLSAHPDFDAVKKTDEFKEWVMRQPQERGKVGQSLFDALNGWDAQEAIHAINIYKADMDKKNNTRAKTDVREAASSVSRNPTSVPSEAGARKPTFRESDIDAMSFHQYNKMEKAIEEARVEGRIEYDVTAGAR